MQLSNYELDKVMAGAINATFLNAIVRGFTFIFELGKSIGSSINRLLNRSSCSLNNQNFVFIFVF